MSKQTRKRLPREPVEARVESLAPDGRGLARIEGNEVFIHGALPGERVLFRYIRRRRHHTEGAVLEVLEPSPDRVAPRCPHFGLCGGCSLQHLRPEVQIRAKQRVLLDALTQMGIEAQAILPPLVAAPWGYRRKARLGVKYVPKKGRVLVGFRERGSSFLTDLTRCEILHPKVGQAIEPLGGLVQTLSTRDRVPQIEVSMGDGPCVLIFRVLQPPTEQDLARLDAFGRAQGFSIWIQDGGPESLRPLPGHAVDLSYTLTRFALRLRFRPTDFTQVNAELNQMMVAQALSLLDPQPDDRVLDLFCGLGNFTLPLAQRAAQVVAVEGEAGLVGRGRENAAHNGLHNLSFYTTDLYQPLDNEPWLHERFDKALLDPPRSGALEVLDHLPTLGVRRILYISCNPSTLARDADRLVSGLGYRLQAAGVMDMFPHTAHVESIALFEHPEAS